MRTVTYGAACSLDGFIAAADGTVDWLHFSQDVHDIMATYWATIDTLLVGRKTWEVMQRGVEGAGAEGAGAEGAGAEGGGGEGGVPSMEGITTYVFSRTLREVSGDARLVREDAGEFVRDLKRRPGKGICVMGGGELAQSLFEAGVIDEVGANIHPILLGSGVPLFRDPGRRIPLELIESRTIDGGCVYAIYRVRHAG